MKTSHFSSAPPDTFSDVEQYRDCPRCNGTVVRVRRRAIDRLLSHFRTVYRYQCLSLHCRWRGNLRPDRGRREKRGGQAGKALNSPPASM